VVQLKQKSCRWRKNCDERKLEVLYARQVVRQSRVNTRVRSVLFGRFTLLGEFQHRCVRTTADTVYNDTRVFERAEQYLRKRRRELSR